MRDGSRGGGRWALYGFIALAASGCLSPARVETEAQSGADLRSYETVAIAPLVVKNGVMRTDSALAGALVARATEGLEAAGLEVVEGSGGALLARLQVVACHAVIAVAYHLREAIRRNNQRR